MQLTKQKQMGVNTTSTSPKIHTNSNTTISQNNTQSHHTLARTIRTHTTTLTSTQPNNPIPMESITNRPLTQKEKESTLPILLSNIQNDILFQTTIHEADKLRRALGTMKTPTPLLIQETLTKAHIVASETYGIAAAQLWSEGFEFPPDVGIVGENLLRKHNYNAITAFEEHHNKRNHQYLNHDRVISVFGKNGHKIPDLDPVDFQRILQLAEEGIKVITPTGFIPYSQPQPFRDLYLKVAPAVHKTLMKQINEGSVIAIPTACAIKLPNIHFSVQHWTTKKNKPQGRVICDTSNTELQNVMPLNGNLPDGRREVRMACEERWGKIVLPTLQDIARMILRTADKNGGMANITLWLSDLQGAFTLLRMQPQSSLLLAFALIGGITIIHLCGMFGWVGLPHAFNVISRLLQLLNKHTLKGESAYYVDDCIGACHIQDLTHDMDKAKENARALLGPSAVAVEKDSQGRELDVLGWHINLNTQLITMSERNFLKAIHAFFSFNIKDTISLRQLEVMSSLASRYSALCRQMKPFTRALYAYQQHYGQDLKRQRHLNAEVKASVSVWRAFLMMTWTDPGKYTRTIESFRERAPSIVMEYDACLMGIACGISKLETNGEKTLLAYTAIEPPFECKDDSSYQNTCEYMAILVGLHLAFSLGLRNFTYNLIGDSVTSLTWITKDQVKSDIAMKTNLAITLLSVEINATVGQTVAIKSKENATYDALSRLQDPTTVGLNKEKLIPVPLREQIQSLIAICNPTIPLTNVEDYFTTMTAITHYIDSNGDELVLTKKDH